MKNNKASKPLVIIAIVLGILLVLVFPIRCKADDGSRVVFKSFLLRYENVHSNNADGTFDTGKVLYVLGKEKYNTVRHGKVFKKKQPKEQYREANLPIHSITDKLLAACEEQSVWMKNADYDWEKNPTIQSSKTHGTCVTYVACVLQRVGILRSGESLWHTGKGYGTGKVTGANDKMTVMYMNNKKLSSLKDELKPGDIVMVDDNKSGESGSGGHIFILTGDWNGNSPYIWDNFTAQNGQKPSLYSGNRKVLAVVRLKDYSDTLQNTTWTDKDGTTYEFKENGEVSVSANGTKITDGAYFLYANENSDRYKAFFDASPDALQKKFSEAISDKDGLPLGLCLITDSGGVPSGESYQTLFEYYGWYEGDKLILAEIATDKVLTLTK